MQNYNAQQTYYASGQIGSKQYFLDDKRHRTDGPAVISYYKSGQIEHETYWLNGRRDRIGGGPAVVWYNRFGQIESEHYYLHSQRHRTDGPATIHYYYNELGNSTVEYYYLDDRWIDMGCFANEMRKSTCKTETLMRVLNTKQELRSSLVRILPNMFRNEIDPQVFNNLTMFF